MPQPLFLAARFPGLSSYARTVAEMAPNLFELVLDGLERGISVARLERALVTVEPHVWREWVEVVLAQWAEDDERIARGGKARMRTALWTAYGAAMDALEFKGAIAALDKLCKLDGLYEPLKLEETAPSGQRERLRTLLDDPRVREKLLGASARN